MVTIKHAQSGYIAVLSITIISVVLMVSVVHQSVRSYISRQTLLDIEMKMMSRAYAHACLHVTHLAFVEDTDYDGMETVSVGNGMCNIEEVQTNNGEKIVTVSAIHNDVTTVYEARIHADPFSLSWREI